MVHLVGCPTRPGCTPSLSRASTRRCVGEPLGLGERGPHYIPASVSSGVDSTGPGRLSGVDFDSPLSFRDTRSNQRCCAPELLKSQGAPVETQPVHVNATCEEREPDATSDEPNPEVRAVAPRRYRVVAPDLLWGVGCDCGASSPRRSCKQPVAV